MAEEDAQVGALDAGGGEKFKLQQQQQSQPVAMPRKNDAAKKQLIISSNSNYKTDLLLSNKRHACTTASDSEEGFLSTSPDSANGEGSNVNDKKPAEDGNLGKTAETTTKPITMTTTTITITSATERTPPPPIFLCTNPTNCVSLKNILDSFKAPLSEEQAWALIHQFMVLYRNVAAAAAANGERHIFTELEIPDTMENLNMHRDGSVHCSWTETERKEKEEKQQQFQQHEQQQTESDEHERGV